MSSKCVQLQLVKLDSPGDSQRRLEFFLYKWFLFNARSLVNKTYELNIMVEDTDPFRSPNINIEDNEKVQNVAISTEYWE